MTEEEISCIETIARPLIEEFGASYVDAILFPYGSNNLEDISSSDYQSLYMDFEDRYKDLE